MNTTSYHLQACMEAWLHCENLLVSIFQKPVSFSIKTTTILDECARICFGTLENLNDQCKNINELALLCVGICEECAEVCERYKEEAFQSCALSCRNCVSLFAPIATGAI